MTIEEFKNAIYSENIKNVLQFVDSLDFKDPSPQNQNLCKGFLFFAIQLKSVEVLNKLIEKGIDVNVKNEWNNYVQGFEDDATALHLAVLSKNPEIITILMTANNIDKDIKDGNGDTALMRALKEKEGNMALALIESGADLNKRNKAGETALMLALQYGQTPIVEKLLSMPGVAVNAVSDSGKAALHFAAKYASADIVEKLIKAGAKVRITEESPTHVTVCLAGAEAPITYNRNKTVLHVAAKHGDVQMVKNLLEAGADAQARDGNKDTAWTIARNNKKTAVAEFLATVTKEALTVPSQSSQSASQSSVSRVVRKDSSSDEKDVAPRRSAKSTVFSKGGKPTGRRGLSSEESFSDLEDEAPQQTRSSAHRRPFRKDSFSDSE